MFDNSISLFPVKKKTSNLPNSTQLATACLKRVKTNTNIIILFPTSDMKMIFRSFILQRNQSITKPEGQG